MGGSATETPIWLERPPKPRYDPAWIRYDGLERCLAILSGEIPPPPFEWLTGLRPVAYERGVAVYELPVTDWLLDATGVVSSGVLAFAADAPLGGCAISSLPVGAFIATSEMSINYVRPALPSARSIAARAHVIHMGHSFALSEVRIEDASGTLLAHGTSRNLVMHFPVPEGIPEAQPVEAEGPWENAPYRRQVRGATLPQMAGDLPEPPIQQLFGIRRLEVGEGSMVAAAPATRWLGVVGRRIFGGAVALFADWTMFQAMLTTLPASTAGVPLDLKVQYLRPLSADRSNITVKARVVHRGQRLGICNAEVLSAEGKTAAVATSSFLIVPDFVWPTSSSALFADALDVAGEEPVETRSNDA